MAVLGPDGGRWVGMQASLQECFPNAIAHAGRLTGRGRPGDSADQ